MAREKAKFHQGLQTARLGEVCGIYTSMLQTIHKDFDFLYESSNYVVENQTKTQHKTQPDVLPIQQKHTCHRTGMVRQNTEKRLSLKEPHANSSLHKFTERFQVWKGQACECEIENHGGSGLHEIT